MVILIKDQINGDNNKVLTQIQIKDGIITKIKDGTIIQIKDGDLINLIKVVGVTIKIKVGTIRIQTKDGVNNNQIQTGVKIKIKEDGDNSQILIGDKTKTKDGIMDQLLDGVIKHTQEILGDLPILIIGTTHSE